MEQEPEQKVVVQVSQVELEWDFQLQLVEELLAQGPHQWDQGVQPQFGEVHCTLHSK